MSAHTDREVTITIGTDGRASCLATDAIDLTELGHVTMERWSNVEWSEQGQRWEARLVKTGELIAWSFNRERCIHLERLVYDQMKEFEDA